MTTKAVPSLKSLVTDSRTSKKRNPVANITWEVPVLSFADLAELLLEAKNAEIGGDIEKHQSLCETIRSLPGFPHNASLGTDLITVVAKNARIQVGGPLPGLPGSIISQES